MKKARPQCPINGSKEIYPLALDVGPVNVRVAAFYASKTGVVSGAVQRCIQHADLCSAYDVLSDSAGLVDPQTQLGLLNDYTILYT